jgi:SOS response regulatory protein OraA/RecX
MALPPKTITALRPAGRERIAVELDGARWRIVPLEAAVRAGLTVGGALDQGTARVLSRELRRVKAQQAALTALCQRDHSVASLRDRLERRGIRPAEREEALATVTRARLVDDVRLAHRRAVTLAARGFGDCGIADDLVRRGLPPALVQAALAELEPELERAERVVATRGRSARTARGLAARGFGEETLSSLIAEIQDGAVGYEGCT